MPYATLEDVETIVREQIPEGLRLEYKSAAILSGRDAPATLCKTVSALANSAGGVFIIGIEAKDGVPVRIGGAPGNSRRDWIFQIINGGTFPAIESLEVREFVAPSGSIYVIDVPPSPQAPHQSNDHKYYKRRGSHSEVMEHYEIEDVRNRPKRPLMPLRADLHTQGILAYLRVTNTHETETIHDLRCTIESNFNAEKGGLRQLSERGLRSLPSKSELHFILGSLIELLQTAEAEVTFNFRYVFQAREVTQPATFHLADFDSTAIMTTPTERAVENLGKQVDKVTTQLERLHRSAESLTGMVDGTGLRISHRTLRLLKDLPQRFDPREFDADGYSIIADISIDDARAIRHALRYPSAQAKELYEKVAPEARTRFEQHFKIEFDD